MNTYTGENLNTALIQAADGVAPQTNYTTTPVMGSEGAETQITQGTSLFAYFPARKASKMRSLLFVTSAGTGLVDITLTPYSGIPASSTNFSAGTPVTLATGQNTTEIFDLPVSSFPYSNFYRIDVTETGGVNTLNFYISMMYRGGA